MRTILCLSPHPDDCELGCGATIAKLADQGNSIYYMAFTDCNTSGLMEEMSNATRIIGVKPENVIVLTYPEVRKFPERRQEILEDLVKIRQHIQPHIVFLPSVNDIHQDHRIIYEEGVRAFKTGNILGYEMPWNNLNTALSCFSIVDEKHINKKVMAVGEYKSQATRPYTKDFIRPLARVRGVQANAQYAEAFEVIRFRI